MALQALCAPSLVYLIFSIAHIVLDISKGLYNTAMIKFLIFTIISLLLNYLCQSGYRIIAWVIVFIPLILMTVITSILLFGIGLDPYKGNLKLEKPHEERLIDVRKQYKDRYGEALNADATDETNYTSLVGATPQNM